MIRVNLFIVVAIVLFTKNIYAQTLVKQWDYRYGGTNDEWLFTLLKTTDGGYALGGFSRSGISGDKSQACWGERDFWMVKTNSSGILQWEKRFGGSNADIFHSMIQTSDGGFLLGGMSNSPMNGDKSQPVQGTFDYWIVKTDASGNKIWDRRFGGTSSDDLQAIQQSDDGGYILAGRSLSGIGGDKTQASWGYGDWWIVKIDVNGNLLWEKTFGGSGDEFLHDVLLTSDGGYLLGGYSDSPVSGDKSQPSQGFHDFWILKIDASGNKQWDKRFGGAGTDLLNSFVETPDGGYALAGITWSPAGGDKTQPIWGWNDYWLVKIDASGNKLWDKDFGGNELEDLFGNVTLTDDGGLLMAGASYTDINGDKTEANLGQEQMWLLKTDASGNKIWDKTILNTGIDWIAYAVQSSEFCYVFANWTRADVGGHKTQPNHDVALATNDFWITEFCEFNIPLPVTLTSFTGTVNYERNTLKWTTSGEINNDYFSLQRCKDGISFTEIARINGAGNTTNVQHYLYHDINPPPGINYYRLCQTDYDGTISFSEIITLSRNVNTDNLYISQFQGLITISGTESGELENVHILDVTGSCVYSGKNNQIDISHLSTGMYFVKVQSGYHSHVFKFFVE